MNKKYWPLVLIVILGVILFFVRRSQNEPGKAKVDTHNQRERKDPAATVDRDRGFDRRIAYIEYTQHARCRMDCRHISPTEVEEIMRDGKINYSKSNVNAKPCPEYALEGVTQDNQRVRIVFAQCDYKSKVVTAIDLGTDWSCNCPGDHKKHQNKN